MIDNGESGSRFLMKPLHNPDSTSPHFVVTKSMFRASLARDVNYRIQRSGGRCNVEENFFRGKAYKFTGKLYSARHVRMTRTLDTRTRRVPE